MLVEPFKILPQTSLSFISIFLQNQKKKETIKKDLKRRGVREVVVLSRSGPHRPLTSPGGKL
jgi:hypothetical protein